ncbi:glutathione S-transferase 1-like isoform X2 [Sitophilus oryzae]|uniref:Glutathione S-transferase 1-like isoform X2 n=1 Tax=Sitophilus oryzae TaxID=7048 RepID=A0A6J2X2C0_SITOR|nr:glutathione S-transferase 1-like isoform X2 [Sitophilus oryzae]
MVDQKLFFESDTLCPRVNSVIAIVIENEKEIPTEKISAITESYKLLDGFLENTTFLAGDSLTVADLCCVATVSTATVITPISTEKYPNLSQWYRTCKNLDYYESSNGNGLNKLDALVELKLGRPRTKELCE